MAGIHVYNRLKEDYSPHPNNYYIGRGGILGNPYTHKDLNKTQALYRCRSREDAINRYSSYFDMMYSSNKEFRKIIDEIYEKYKNGEDVFLECYCGVGDNGKKNCHGEVIVEKLQKRLIKEKFKRI